MAYCYSCGSLIGTNDKFCNNCGAAAAAQMTPQNYTHTPVQQDYGRKGALIEINRLIEYFSVKQAQYDEYDVCSQNIEYLSNPRSPLQINMIPGTPLIVIGSIIMAFGLLTSYAYARFGLLFLFFGGSVLAGGIVLNCIRNTKLRAYRNELILQSQNRYAELSKELSDYYMNYGYCQTSPEYTNPKILVKLREYIWSGRADSIKESINILHQEAHNSEMELQAALMARSAASAARGANTAAFFSAANFFLK